MEVQEMSRSREDVTKKKKKVHAVEKLIHEE